MSAFWPNRVAIGSFVADNADASDFRVTAQVSGWGSAPIRLEFEDKMQQDGAWDATPYYSSRPVTITGVVDQPSYAAAVAVAEQLRALSVRTVHELVVENDVLGARSALVRVEVGADPEWISANAFRYTIQLRAADPLLYGPLEFATANLSSSSGGAGLTYPLAYPLDYGLAPGAMPGAVEVSNAGTSSYFPRLRIDGPVTNPVVTAATGDQLIYTGTVAAGQWLDIDCARRRVLLNGRVSMRHRMSFSGGWLAVPVGGGAISWNADTADPACSLSVWSYEGAWS